ncbi:velvet factor-domain-containing protein [Radiomyces spectabilis]|uniref:velvet factor-domain-containing protein n=1 Tax=Radiomyces spectabilis TaxID=64574 RepID=UPI00221FCF2B|nr:velvet factor-domain-containing protein [Radiomyces spectabilis]KAI8377618.1 velvet factor-domain-containing protein [Radiomyces spectabilis]
MCSSAPSSHTQIDHGLKNNMTFQLIMRQQPIRSRMCGVGDKVDRRPIDPPPIVELRLEENSHILPMISPHLFLAAILVEDSGSEHRMQSLDELNLDVHSKLAIGRTVSSLYLLRDLDNTEGAFFVFSDISVRAEGHYRLRMCLFEIVNGDVYFRQSILTNPFVVYSAKKFPGMYESCPLARHFAEQGLKIRIRKESRTKKHNAMDADPKSRSGTNSDAEASDISSTFRPIAKAEATTLISSKNTYTTNITQHTPTTSASLSEESDFSNDYAENSSSSKLSIHRILDSSDQLDQSSVALPSILTSLSMAHFTATATSTSTEQKAGMTETALLNSITSNHRLSLAHILHPTTQKPLSRSSTTNSTSATQHDTSTSTLQNTYWQLPPPVSTRYQQSMLRSSNPLEGSQSWNIPSSSASLQNFRTTRTHSDRPEIILSTTTSRKTNLALPSLREQLQDFGIPDNQQERR